MDAVVPVTSTRYSLNALNLKVNKPWHYWVDDLGEVCYCILKHILLNLFSFFWENIFDSDLTSNFR